MCVWPDCEDCGRLVITHEPESHTLLAGCPHFHRGGGSLAQQLRIKLQFGLIQQQSPALLYSLNPKSQSYNHNILPSSQSNDILP